MFFVIQSVNLFFFELAKVILTTARSIRAKQLEDESTYKC